MRKLSSRQLFCLDSPPAAVLPQGGQGDSAPAAAGHLPPPRRRRVRPLSRSFAPGSPGRGFGSAPRPGSREERPRRGRPGGPRQDPQHSPALRGGGACPRWGNRGRRSLAVPCARPCRPRGGRPGGQVLVPAALPLPPQEAPGPLRVPVLLRLSPSSQSGASPFPKTPGASSERSRVGWKLGGQKGGRRERTGPPPRFEETPVSAWNASPSAQLFLFRGPFFPRPVPPLFSPFLFSYLCFLIG